MVAILEREALYKISFLELTGTQHPWDVDYKILKQVQAKLKSAEETVRKTYPDEELTCVISGHGAFWLPLAGLEEFVKGFEKPLNKLKLDGPLPVWKLTTAEVIASHISNMRRLLLTACHDLILLEQLKDSLGNNHTFLQREFENCERTVRKLLEEIAKQGPNLTRAISTNFMLMDRVRITEEMIERGELKSETLGYSLDDLRRAENVLEERCKKELPAFRQRLQALFNQMQQALREGESTQLIRASRWEMAFAMIGKPPPGFQGYSIVSEAERNSMSIIVSSREEELGSSEIGKTAMKATNEVRSMKGEISEPEPVEEKPPEETAEEVESENENKKNIRRMAFHDRKRR
jgi:exonuclease VII small subunit